MNQKLQLVCHLVVVGKIAEAVLSVT